MFARLWGRPAPSKEDLYEFDLCVDPPLAAGPSDSQDAHGRAAATAAAVYPLDDLQDKDQDGESPVPPAVLESIARRVLAEVMAEEVRRGQPYEEEQRRQLAVARGEVLCLEWMRDQQAHSQHQELLAELQALRHATANMERRQAAQAESSPGTQLVDLWRRHPFLVGWFGAGAVHAMKRGRRP